MLGSELEHIAVSSKPSFTQFSESSRSSRFRRTVTKAALALTDSQMLRDRRRAFRTRDETRARLRADYLELPGLTLTVDQAARLWSIDRSIAMDVLDELAATGFLLRSGDHYARR